MTTDPQFGNLKFLSFEDGLKRIEAAVKRLERDSLCNPGSEIITSLDPTIQELVRDLRLEGLPRGASKWQLPVYFNSVGAQFFLSLLEPHLEVDEHAHHDGASIRVILNGSIKFKKAELRQGDWMFVPQHTPYSFRVGDYGAMIFYCYPCCCVPN